jgi:Fe/S biogenesis protein NfuA
MSIDTAELETEEVVLAVTEEAATKVLEVRGGEESPESLALRVEIIGVSGVDFTYDLSFEAIADADGDDVCYESGGLPLMVPADTVDRLRGATLDLPSNAAQGGLVIKNPNRPDMLDGKQLELNGTSAEKLQQLLDQQINPSLAAHGGFAELVGVDAATAYITMGGGCQGCSMSAATLREGITVMIGQAIPEITEVIDATDHSAGQNPFYT